MKTAAFTDLAPGDRPREKLERHGPGALGDNELLALVIGHGTAGRSGLAIATAVLSDVGGVRRLTRVSRARIARIAGVGPVMASRIQAAIELGRRTLAPDVDERPQLLTSAQMAAVLLPHHGAHPVERFGVVLLDTRMRLLRVQVVSVGTLDAAAADPREVFREATIAGAAFVVLFHNHPSGDPLPSRDDYALTRRLVAAGHLLGIEVVEHLILADTRYYSMRDRDFPRWRE